MVRFFAALFAMLISANFAGATIIRWDGEGGDGQWSNPLNWTGNILPAVTDDVVLDNSMMQIDYEVILPGISVSVHTLLILPSSNSSILLVLPSTNVITSGAFSTNGLGYSFIIGAGGTFINNGTVTSGTNLIISDSFQIRNGGRYVHRTRSGHSTWLAKVSRMPETNLGTIEFDVPVSSYVVSLSGRVYGNLVLSSAMNGSPVTYSGNGSQNVLIRGELQLMHSSTLTLSFSGGEFVVNGDFKQSASSTFNLQASSNNNIVRLKGDIFAQGTITETGTGNPQMILNKSSIQTVSINSLQGNITVDIDCQQGIDLAAPMTIPHVLRLTSGKIKSTMQNILTIADNATILGSSSERFIAGPLRKIGDEAFTFPIGKGLHFASLGLSGGGNVADDYVAEYNVGNPQTHFGSDFDASSISHMSGLEWWTVYRQSGITARQVTLLVTTYSDATLLEHLRVLRYDDTQWQNEGNAAFSGLAFGTLTSQPVSDFNPPGSATAITLGSSSPLFNPLPVVLEFFRADRINSREAILKWRLSEYPSTVCTFTLERDNGFGFSKIAEMQSANDLIEYEYRLFIANPGIWRFRLKIQSPESGESYSQIITVHPFVADPLMMYLPSVGSLVINSTHRENALLLMLDLQGRILQKKSLVLEMGANYFLFPTHHLPAGIYVIAAQFSNGEIRKIKVKL